MEYFESCLYISNKTALVNIEWKKNKFLHISGNSSESKYAVVPIQTEENFQLFNSSVSLNGNGFHHMVPLILREWQPGGQLKQMERKYVTRCMSILKVTTRNGQIKAGKGEFSKQPLKEEEEPGENPSTHICCTSSGSIPIF